MFYFNKLESKIIEALSERPYTSKSLVNKISKENQISREAVYKALRKLKSRLIISYIRKNVSLYFFFLEWMRAFSAKTIKNYSQQVVINTGVRKIIDGKTKKYTFHVSNFDQLNTTFMQIAFSLSQNILIKKELPYIYSSFSAWWFPFWQEEFETYMKYLQEIGFRVVVMVKSPSVFDTQTKKNLQKINVTFRVIGSQANIPEEAHIFSGYILQTKYNPDFFAEVKKKFFEFKTADTIDEDKKTDFKNYFANNLNKTRVILNKINESDYKKILSLI